MSSGDEPQEPTALQGDGAGYETSSAEGAGVSPASSAYEGGVHDGTAPIETAGSEAVGVLAASPHDLAVPTLELTAPASTLTIREADGSATVAASTSPDAAEAAPLSRPIERPTFVFLGIVSALTLAADIGSKAWAEVALNRRGFEPIDLIGQNLSITLAYNKGGAWGMFQDAGEMVRKPFFICVSLAAIWFIVSLYARLSKSQRALTWGLPLVLGGALGNLSDRITRSQVIDFIDYKADWVMRLNAWIRQHSENWAVTDHWPTFNVADIAICIGVGLMAVDMYTSRRRPNEGRSEAPRPPGPQNPQSELPRAEGPSTSSPDAASFSA